MKKLAVFDLDNTIYQGYCQNDLAKFLFAKGKISARFLIKILWWIFLKKIGRLDDQAAYANALVLLKNKDLRELEKWAGDYFGAIGKNKINSKIYPLIKKLKCGGFKLLLATEAMDFLAEKFSRYLGFDYLIATEPEIISQKISGKIKGKVFFGENKKEALELFCKRNKFDLKNSSIYGGRIGDRFILELSAQAFVIDPDERTKKFAKIKNWQILS